MGSEARVEALNAMQEYFDRSTRVFAEGDSGFTPKPGMFTVAQQVAHVAQTIDWFMAGAFDPKGFNLDFEGLDAEVRKVESLTAARAWLKQAFDGARATLESKHDEMKNPLPPGPIMGGQPRSAILPALGDHTAHHRGALTVYARLLGKTAPMPYMEM
jgi:uncharacterized damage-inducible protein DinB